MTRRLSFAAGIFFLLTIAPASGGTPFGGDDVGFVPPSPPAKRCEEAVLGSATRLARCLVKCHAKVARLALKGQPLDDEPCEQICLDKFTNKAGELIAVGGCPPCLDLPGQTAVATQVETFIDSLNGEVYCAPGTPFSGDDGGNLPTDKDMARCQSRVGMNAGHFLNCVRLAHMKAARQAFRGGAFDDETREQAKCRAQYDQMTLSTTAHPGCPACLDAAAQGGIGTQADQFADTSLGGIYCASPSGAFVGEGG